MNVDCFTYNGEREVLRIHLECTPWVDKYIIVEANQTFTGKPKPLYFFRDNRYYKPWWNKIDYFVVNQWDDEALWQEARNSPATKGAEHWKREFYIKESIQKALRSCGTQPDDVVYVGDVDEIPLQWDGPMPVKLRLKVYANYLNNRSNELFWGTYVAPYSEFKDKIINHERNRKDILSVEEEGWHFTSMGGLKEVQRKLNDTYTAETYATPTILEKLPELHARGLDVFGRGYEFKIDESEWPTYLQENRNKFKHLCL